MSPVPALVCALLLCGVPPHATGPTDARPAPEPTTFASVGGPSAVPVPVPVSGGEGPEPDLPESATAPAPGPALSPEPDATPTTPAGPSGTPETDPAADPSREDTPVVRYTVASPQPTTTPAGVLGHISTGLLATLGLLVLGLRLSVGWPRFPDPYLGRRRRSPARRCG
ncbi:hypothetical protein [Nocardiopsis kunsanensis]|uniref:Uncharacterized protein n=1 Tax=Nocardiopsis kunsanensis TaxID=141693 RepID=A0A918XI42_9ACTN|nr:hypothetical protein [Nocardiopsis kunsanensis]GHD31751.1 hypothetical protein GCM10007147_34680 [Nocardiopsis kunsanensis]